MMGYVAVAVSGSIFAARGIITIGDIQAFIQYVRNFTQPIQQLAQVSNMLQSMAAASERVFEFLGEPEEEQNADPARRADPACIDGHSRIVQYEVQGLCFRLSFGQAAFDSA